MPDPELACGLGQDEGADVADQPAAFGQRNETGRFQQDAVAAAQPNKRLEAGQLAVCHAHDRLVDDFEALFLQGVLQVIHAQTALGVS